MKRESLDALGAVPLDNDIARQLGLDGLADLRARLPEMIGKTARVIAENPKPILLAGCGSYVVTSALLNLVKPRGPLGAFACGIVSVTISGALMAELAKRDIITFRMPGDA